MELMASFTSLDIQTSRRCIKDHVSIIGLARRKAKFCGNSYLPRNLVSLGKYIQVAFKSRKKTAAPGFELEIQGK